MGRPKHWSTWNSAHRVAFTAAASRDAALAIARILPTRSGSFFRNSASGRFAFFWLQA
jgi:hypothetical protein